eukprot:125685-Chlamydomonas_euryale.AAC.4
MKGRATAPMAGPACARFLHPGDRTACMHTGCRLADQSNRRTKTEQGLSADTPACVVSCHAGVVSCHEKHSPLPLESSQFPCEPGL